MTLDIIPVAPFINISNVKFKHKHLRCKKKRKTLIETNDPVNGNSQTLRQVFVRLLERENDPKANN